MRAVYYGECGRLEVLRYGEVPDAVPGPGQVLIRVEVVSIEGGDLAHRRAVPPTGPRHVPGYQAAGVVVARGEGVAAPALGRRVVAFADRGSHAELFAAPATSVFEVPDGLDAEAAAAVPVTFGTASDALFEFGALRAGQTVLVHGVAGGVGVACVQLAARAGAHVLGTARGADRLARLRDLGMAAGIDHGSEDVGVRAGELTGGAGVDLVVDMAGGAALPRLLAALRQRGRFVTVGAASGQAPVFTFRDLIGKELTVSGVYLGLQLHTPRVRALVAGLLDDVRAGRLTMPVDRVFPLAEAAAAHRHMEEGRPFGRVLMRP